MDLFVKWSPEASEDLQSIADYIAKDSEFYARSVVTDILSITRSLSDYPLIGRIVPELGDEDIRERLIYSYRIVYCRKPDEILIVAVIHGKQLIENISSRV